MLCAQNRVVFSNALPGLARICLHLPICFAPHTLAVCTIVLRIRHKMKLQPTWIGKHVLVFRLSDFS